MQKLWTIVPTLMTSNVPFKLVFITLSGVIFVPISLCSLKNKIEKSADKAVRSKLSQFSVLVTQGTFVWLYQSEMNKFTVTFFRLPKNHGKFNKNCEPKSSYKFSYSKTSKILVSL